MGCCQASETIAASAPNPPANYYSNYEEHKGPFFVTAKDSEAKIVFAEAGPASQDEKTGSPPKTVASLFSAAVKSKGDMIAMRIERLADGKAPSLGADKSIPPPLPTLQWKTWTWKEYYDDCNKVAKSMLALGVEQFGTVAIWGFNSPEWIMAMMGAALMGAKAAGIYPTDTPEQVKFKCSHSSADVIVVEDMKKFRIVKSICEGLKDLKAVVMWGDEPPEKTLERKDCPDVPVLSWAEYLEYGSGKEDMDKKLSEASAKIKPGHCVALIYTSGTTGRPKAVMSSNDNLCFEASALNKTLPAFGSANVAERLISYLPLSHIAGMLVDVIFPMFATAYTSAWFEVWFARPYDLKYGSLKDRLVACKPSLFVGVPRVWEKIAEKMQARSASLSGAKLKIARWAKGKGLEHALNSQLGGSGAYGCCYCLADKLILSKVKEALGLSEMKFGITAAAPIGRHTLEYYGALGIQINEVYGMSESTGGSTVSINSTHVWGSCGYQIGGMEIKVFKRDDKDINKKIECPRSKDIFKPTEDEQGEICFRGRSVMMGYLANPDFGEEHVAEITKKNEGAIDEEGWLHSGDKGCVSERGMFRITGRYKELIIGAGGENVAPVPIETNVKKLCNIISNIMMFGDKKKFNVAVVTLKAKGASGQEPGTIALDGPAAKLVPSVKTIPQAMHDEKFIKTITDAIVATNKNEECCPSNAAKVQKFTILPADFSIETGELTSTLKLKRSVAAKKFMKAIDAMYESKETYVPYYSKAEADEIHDKFENQDKDNKDEVGNNDGKVVGDEVNT